MSCFGLTTTHGERSEWSCALALYSDPFCVGGRKTRSGFTVETISLDDYICLTFALFFCTSLLIDLIRCNYQATNMLSKRNGCELLDYLAVILWDDLIGLKAVAGDEQAKDCGRERLIAESWITWSFDGVKNCVWCGSIGLFLIFFVVLSVCFCPGGEPGLGNNCVRWL